MSELYRDLTTATRDNRRRVAQGLVRAMAAPESSDANRQVQALSSRIIDTQITDNDYFITPGSAESGAMDLFTAGSIVENVTRTRGYLQAIKRARLAFSAIDAGCGPTAVLSLALATFHPRAEIIAYEVNEPAARCARAMVELMGMNDQITVRTENVLTTDLPTVVLGVTETFNRGLAIEKGARIAHRLSTVAAEIIPAKAIIHGRAGGYPNADPWQQAGVVDFWQGGDLVHGSFAAFREGEQDIRVYADYLDARDEPVVAGYGSDAITTDISIGRVHIPHAESRVHFTYPTGHLVTAEAATLWIAS